MLCKTYKKDEVFASSISKLLQNLEYEMKKETAEFEKYKRKKSTMKHQTEQLH